MQKHYQKSYLSKPFLYKLDSNSKSLMEILSILEGNEHGGFAFVGGFMRDYGKRPYNDLDITATNPDFLRNALATMHVLKLPNHEDRDNQIPHDTYFNPYVFDHSGVPIHFIYAGNEQAYAPNSFDFSVNEFALKSDMHVYAPTYAWRDIYGKLLRFNENRPVTTNVVMRGIRFAAKTGFIFEPKTSERFVEFLKTAKSGIGKKHNGWDVFEKVEDDTQLRIGSNHVLLGIDKMIEDGVEIKAFEILKQLKFEGVNDLKNIHELREIHNNLMLTGKAHIDTTRVY